MPYFEESLKNEEDAEEKDWENASDSKTSFHTYDDYTSKPYEEADLTTEEDDPD